jgi:hypothetical protein
MKKSFAVLAVACLLSAWFASPALAVARYECKGLASDAITLTPHKDGSVNLSFDKNVTIVGTTQIAHKGDVFAAEFNLSAGTLVYIFDTLTKNGYEYFRRTDNRFGAAKLTCWWFQE